MGNKTFRSHLKLHGDSLSHLTCKIFGIKPLMEATRGFEIRQWRSLALYHLDSDYEGFQYSWIWPWKHLWSIQSYTQMSRRHSTASSCTFLWHIKDDLTMFPSQQHQSLQFPSQTPHSLHHIANVNSGCFQSSSYRTGNQFISCKRIVNMSQEQLPPLP